MALFIYDGYLIDTDYALIICIQPIDGTGQYDGLYFAMVTIQMKNMVKDLPISYKSELERDEAIRNLQALARQRLCPPPSS